VGVIEGVPPEFTVPLTATFLAVAPPPVTVTLAGPIGPVAAVDAMRTQTSVAASGPLAVIVAVAPKPVVAEVVDTSKFAGAVTVKLPVRFEPLTWKGTPVPADPAIAARAVMEDGVTKIVGVVLLPRSERT
jgi:hypothetical protein